VLLTGDLDYKIMVEILPRKFSVNFVTV